MNRKGRSCEGKRCRYTPYSPTHSGYSGRRRSNINLQHDDRHWKRNRSINEDEIALEIGKGTTSQSDCSSLKTADSVLGKRKFLDKDLTQNEYLQELISKSPIHALGEALRKESRFRKLLMETELEQDLLLLVIKLSSRLCTICFAANKYELLSIICSSQILRNINILFGDVISNISTISASELIMLIENLTVFISAVVNTAPSLAYDRKMSNIIKKMVLSISNLNSNPDSCNVDKSVSSQLEDLLSKLNEYETKRKDKEENEMPKNTFSKFDRMIPPENYRDLSLYPTYEDLFVEDSRRIFLRPSKEVGAYQCVDSYLDIQFRLLREDFINPLRNGLRIYLENQQRLFKDKVKCDNIRIYYNTRFVSYNFTTNNEVGYIVTFKIDNRRRINWETSKRFIYGSLLIFTSNNFDTFFYGTVMDRKVGDLERGRISVRLRDNSITDKTLFQQNYMMIESEVFFEPYFLVMRALQRLNNDNFPMVKYIISCETTTAPPAYWKNLSIILIGNKKISIATATQAKNSCVKDSLIHTEWPSADDLSLDESQHRAFTNALTSEFCVIQGPPGTGKTYLGLRIVEVLLENKRASDYFTTPILVVCYTNHALDQFLECILNYTDNIVRIGSRSRNEVLEPYNLRSEKMYKKKRPFITNYRHYKQKLEGYVSKISEKSALLDTLNEPHKGVLKHELIRECMGNFVCSRIPRDAELWNWLFPSTDTAYLEITNHRSRRNRDWLLEENNKVPDKKEKCDKNEFSFNNNDYRGLHDPSWNITEKRDKFDPYYSTLANLGETLRTLEQTEKNMINESKWNFRLRGPKFQRDLHNIGTRFEMTRAHYMCLKYQLQNISPMSGIRVESAVNRLFDMPLNDRWSLYWYWLQQLKVTLTDELNNLHRILINKKNQYDEFREMDDLHAVKDCDVIGMTTTCAARLHAMLQELKPQIVIIEEAAEVLESHIVTSLTKDSQHVILIGDHKQLKPSAAVYRLCEKFNFDISLFERMINNGMYCPMLNIQHRMRPEISSLITPLIYKDLYNHQSVHEYEQVKGMRKSLFFLQHNEFENEVDDSASRINNFEADMAIELCKYLVLQGYGQKQITILTTYTGQMFHIRRLKNNRELLKNVNVIVVDKYQGEESDIIILSLVRSNKEGKIGFLKTENRVCVALSRAKIGLYIIGNMDNLCQSSKIWVDIKKTLEINNSIGNCITLYCEKHQFETNIKTVDDFALVSEGGCNKICGELLQCGHTCQLLCHIIDGNHNETKCKENCNRMCADGLHPCNKKCFETCGKCIATMERHLKCGHTKKLECHIDELQYKCQVNVEDISPHCGHPIIRRCSEKVEDATCSQPCEVRLDCGHSCTKKCHVLKDPNHEEFKCQKECPRLNRGCTRHHPCRKLCFEECNECSISIIELCNGLKHEQRIKCSSDRKTLKCQFKCWKNCENCNETVIKKCWQDEWDLCMRSVLKKFPVCEHTALLPCSTSPEKKYCKRNCKQILPCGHKCRARCNEPCDSKECSELVLVSDIGGLCGHNFVNVPCFMKDKAHELNKVDLLENCNHPCGVELKCGHLCEGKCNECWQGRLHINCKQECNRTLMCGHSCKSKCQKDCPPCQEKCITKCIHSKCNWPCGIPCQLCQEKCKWACIHSACSRKCGQMCDKIPCMEPCEKLLPCTHKCIGFCGEPCPSVCRQCDKDDVENIFFGDEDESNARFVLLEDCGHFFESSGLEKYMGMTPEGQILLKRCPKCTTPIATTKRYMNFVKKIQNDIIQIKEKIFGNEQTYIAQRESLVKKCDELLKITVRDEYQGIHMKMLFQKYEKFFKVQRKTWLGSPSNIESAECSVQLFSVIISLTQKIDAFNSNGNDRLNNTITLIEKYVSKIVMRMVEISYYLKEQHAEDFNSEICRVTNMIAYCKLLDDPNYKSSENFKSPIKDVCLRIEEILFMNTRFTAEKIDLVSQEFQLLQTTVKSNPITSLSDDEKIMVSKVIFGNNRYTRSGRGRWYTCSNGHYYCITECGAPNQTMKCPDCNVPIGGSYRGHVSTSRRADDINNLLR